MPGASAPPRAAGWCPGGRPPVLSGANDCGCREAIRRIVLLASTSSTRRPYRRVLALHHELAQIVAAPSRFSIAPPFLIGCSFVYAITTDVSITGSQ